MLQTIPDLLTCGIDNGEPVSQTGEMKLFSPNKEVNNDEQLDDVV